MSDGDSKTAILRQAIEALASGNFDVALPTDGVGEEAELARAVERLRDRIQARLMEQNYLLSITRAVNSGLTLNEVLEDIFESFSAVIPYDRIGFALIEDQGKVVRAHWARARGGDIHLSSGYSVPLQLSSLRHVISAGRPRILNNLDEYLREHPNSDSTRLLLKEGMLSSLTCPLLVNGTPIGFLFFTSRQPETYRSVHVQFFMQIAEQIALIVDKGRLYQSLLDANELKNRFLGIVVHDLRNPIGIVRGYLQIMLRGIVGEISEKQRELLERMDVASGSMLTLISDLLDISAIESGRFELERQPTDYAAFLAKVRDQNQLLADGKNISIKLEVQGELPNVLMDANRMNQVVSNLLSNAVKFSFSGSAVTIRAWHEDDRVCTVVEDQGQGIHPDDMPKIFSEFSRTRTRPTAGEKSTGLGLAIVKKVILAHGGSVWADSKPGQGSRFGYAIPVSADVVPNGES